MRLVKAAKASPHAKFCDLSTGYACPENAILQCDPTANILDIVQYIVLHPLLSTKVF